jgi:hypothetical protein
LDPGDRADKKPTAKFFFKSLNCCTQRWLRDVASLCCSGEAQIFAHGKKVFDLVYFHGALHARSPIAVPAKR